MDADFEVRDVRAVLYVRPVKNGLDLLTVNEGTTEVTVRCETASPPAAGATAAPRVASIVTETFAFDAIEYAPFSTALYTRALADAVHQQFVAPLVQASTGSPSPPGTQCLTVVQGGPPEHTTETFRLLARNLLDDAECLIGDYASHRFRIDCAAVSHTPGGTEDILQSSQDLTALASPWEVAARHALPAEKISLAIQALLQRVAPATLALKGMRQLRVTLVDTRTGHDVASHTLCLCPPMDVLCGSFLEDVDALRESLAVDRCGRCDDSLLRRCLVSGVYPNERGVRAVDRLVVVSCVMNSTVDRSAGMAGRAIWETCQFGAASEALYTASAARPREHAPTGSRASQVQGSHGHRPTAPAAAQTHPANGHVPRGASGEDAVASAVERVENEWRARLEALEQRANAAAEAAQQRVDEAQQRERDAAKLSATLQASMARMRATYHEEESSTSAQVEAARQLLADYEQKLDDVQERLRDAHRRALTAEREAERVEARLEGFRAQSEAAARRLEAHERGATTAAALLVLEEEQSARQTLLSMEASQRQSLHLQRERGLAEASYEGYMSALQHSKASATADLERLQRSREDAEARQDVTERSLARLSQHALQWGEELARRQDEFSRAASMALSTHDWHARAAHVLAEVEHASELLDAMREEMRQSQQAQADATASAATSRQQAEEAIRLLKREQEAAAQHLDALHQSVTEGSEKYAQLLRNVEKTQAELAEMEGTRQNLIRATQDAQKQFADTRWLLGEKQRELADAQQRAEVAAQALDDTLAHVRAEIETATRAAQAQQREADAQERRREQLERAVEDLLERQRQAEAATAAMASPEYQSAQRLTIEALRRGEEAKRRESAVAQSLQALIDVIAEEESTARRQWQQAQEAARSALQSQARAAQATQRAAVAECALEESRGRAHVEEAEREEFVKQLFDFCVPHLAREAGDAVSASDAARALATAREEKAALEAETELLLNTVDGLQTAKEAIEESIAELVSRLNEATDELEEEESAVHDEAAHAQRLIRLAETEASTRFDAILGRCTELISQSRRRQSSVVSLGTRSLSAHPGLPPFSFPPTDGHARGS